VDSVKCCKQREGTKALPTYKYYSVDISDRDLPDYVTRATTYTREIFFSLMKSSPPVALP